MATTVNSDLIIYNDLAQTAYLERLQEVLAIFNQSSGGALVLLATSLVTGFNPLRLLAFLRAR